jgi:hypothetical protein
LKRGSLFLEFFLLLAGDAFAADVRSFRAGGTGRTHHLIWRVLRLIVGCSYNELWLNGR